MGKNRIKRLLGDKPPILPPTSKRASHSGNEVSAYEKALPPIPPPLPSLPDIPKPTSIPADKSYLPIDILIRIIQYCASSMGTLKNLSLVNHELSIIALRLIWENINVGLNENHPFQSGLSRTSTLVKDRVGIGIGLGISKPIPNLSRDLRGMTRVINCYFRNYKYLTRFSSPSITNPLNRRRKDEFPNLKVLKIHLGTLKGIPGKKGYSERKSLSQDMIPKNYARKLPTNFHTLVWVGVPDGFYRDCCFGCWDDIGFRPFRNRTTTRPTTENGGHDRERRRGPRKIVFQFNNDDDRSTENIIHHVQIILKQAKFPISTTSNLKEMNIVLIPKRSKKIFSIKQNFQTFSNFLIDFLHDWSTQSDKCPHLSIKLVNFGCLDPTWMNFNLNGMEASYSVVRNYLHETWQEKARSQGKRILVDAGEIELHQDNLTKDQKINEVDSDQRGRTKVRRQQILTLEEYLAEGDNGDEFDWEDI